MTSPRSVFVGWSNFSGVTSRRPLSVTLRSLAFAPSLAFTSTSASPPETMVYFEESTFTSILPGPAVAAVAATVVATVVATVGVSTAVVHAASDTAIAVTAQQPSVLDFRLTMNSSHQRPLRFWQGI